MLKEAPELAKQFGRPMGCCPLAGTGCVRCPFKSAEVKIGGSVLKIENLKTTGTEAIKNTGKGIDSWGVLYKASDKAVRHEFSKKTCSMCDDKSNCPHSFSLN